MYKDAEFCEDHLISNQPNPKEVIMSTRPNSKGWQILEAFASTHPAGISRQAAASQVGCTVQRVGEVVRENSSIVFVAEGGGYAVAPEALSTLAAGFSFKAVADADRIVRGAKALANAHTKSKALHPALDGRANYKAVTAAIAAGESVGDVEFEAARAFAKAKKCKAPRR